MIDRLQMQSWASQLGIPLHEPALEHFDRYASFLVEYNEKVNLTAITVPQEIVIKHFLDSLMLLTAVDLPQGAAVADLGTGAGFPGVPLKIVRPDLQVTLIDSLLKRIFFLKELSQMLGQANNCVHGRGEVLGQDKQHRAAYDLVTARAVSNLPALCEYCLPLVKVGGCFVALKGHEIEEEAQRAAYAINLLGGRLEKIAKHNLPGDNKRSLVVIRKTSQTPAKYPRKSVNIAKAPLE